MQENIFVKLIEFRKRPNSQL